jgi:hypothetical protein
VFHRSQSLFHFRQIDRFYWLVSWFVRSKGHTAFLFLTGLLTGPGNSAFKPAQQPSKECITYVELKRTLNIAEFLAKISISLNLRFTSLSCQVYCSCLIFRWSCDYRLFLDLYYCYIFCYQRSFSEFMEQITYLCGISKKKVSLLFFASLLDFPLVIRLYHTCGTRYPYYTRIPIPVWGRPRANKYY